MRQEHILELFCRMEENVRMIKLSLISEQCKRLEKEKNKSGLYS